MKYRKIAVVVGIVFVLLCVGLYIFIYTIPELTGSLKPTTIVNYGEMKISKTVPAIVVRKEAIHDSPVAGNTTYYLDNNIKTRKGTLIMDIYSGEKTSINCPSTGVVSFYSDGYESIFTFETLDIADTLLPKENEKIVVSNLKTSKVEAGSHIYKLISNDTWYTVCLVPTEELPLYVEGAVVTLEFETGSVSATIDHVVGKETTSLVIISTTKYFENYDRLRDCQVNVILQDDKGLIVPNTAIATVDGEPGVYVKKVDGSYVFERIKIINSDSTNSVVYADQFDGNIQTISIYDEILKNASEQN